MYWKDIQHHNLPHFHVRYSGEESVFDLSGEFIVGKASPRTQKLVKEWALERKEELDYAWQQAVQGKEVPWVTPIR